MNVISLEAPKLQPHQRAVYEEFTQARGPNYLAVQWPPGVGIHYTTIQLTTHFYKADPAARVLIVVSEKALAEQFRQQLNHEGTKALLVDSYVFRELVDRVPAGSSIWVEHAVYILPSSLLLRAEVAAELRRTKWEFVAISAGPLVLGGKKSSALKSLLSPAAMPLVLWIASQPDELERLPSVPGQSWRIQALRVKDLVETGSVSFRPVAFEVRVYAPTEGEQTIDALAEKLSKLRDVNAYSEALQILKSEWPSSAAALESAVRRLGRQLSGERNQAEEGVVEESPISNADGVTPSDRDVLSSFVVETLQRLERLDSDSKFGLLSEALNDLQPQIGRGVCVVTRFRSTAAYLQAALQHTAWPVHTAHSGMSVVDREEAFRRFSAEGGVLVSTPSAMTSAPMMGGISALILYDVPVPGTLQRMVGGLRRGPASETLRVCALTRPDDLQSISRLSDAADAIRKEG